VEFSIHVCGDGHVNAAGWEPRNGDLIPVAEIDKNVGEEELFDVVEDCFFLFSFSIKLSSKSRQGAPHIITQNHDTSRRAKS
jgi:hypothetical protein